MSGDANEAVRLKEQKDEERGFDADSDDAHPSQAAIEHQQEQGTIAGGGDSESAPSTSDAVDPAEADEDNKKDHAER